MRAFVTGATGFVGGHLVAALRERGDDVVCLARSPERAAPLAALGARVVPGSLEDGASLAAAARGADVVFHLAGLTAAPSEREFLAVNRDGTARLVAALAAAAPGLRRLVHVSSIAAVGPTARGSLLDEDSTCRPVTAYGRSKLAGETVVRAAPLAWTIVRPAVVYGPGDRELLRMFRIVRRGVAPVFGLRGSAQELSVVHAADLAAALLAAGGAAPAPGRIYHVAHPAIVRVRELARAIGRAVRGREPVLLPVPAALAAPIVRVIARRAAAAGRVTVVSEDKLAEFLAPAWGTSVARAERELGWRATRDLAGGIAETAAWYREHGWLA